MSKFIYLTPFFLETYLSECYCNRDFLPHVLNIRGKVFQVDIEEFFGYNSVITDYCLHSFVFNERQLLDKVLIQKKKLGFLKPRHKTGVFCFYYPEGSVDDNSGIVFSEGLFKNDHVYLEKKIFNNENNLVYHFLPGPPGYSGAYDTETKYEYDEYGRLSGFEQRCRNTHELNTQSQFIYDNNDNIIGYLRKDCDSEQFKKYLDISYSHKDYCDRNENWSYRIIKKQRNFAHMA